MQLLYEQYQAVFMQLQQVLQMVSLDKYFMVVGSKFYNLIASFFLINFSLIISGVPLDAFRNYQTTTNAAAPYVFATHAGQNIQQSALYAAQLQAAQQQAAQFAAATQQQQQQQQQTLINGIPPGYMLVRTSNGGYALLAQSSTAAAAAQQQAQTQLAQQQYFSFNAAGQPTATAARLPVAMVGGQQQQVVYQYAGQPTIQAGPTQYIQLPSNYAQQQQQQQLSTSPIMQTATSAASQGLYIF
jgi:hypothetical protein